MIKTNIGKIEIKAVDMPNSNNTLVIAPINGKRYSIILSGQRIATDVITSYKLRKNIYRNIKERYNEYQNLILN
jgi:hypothetical protein